MKVGIDIGGTKSRIALIDNNKIIDILIFDTNPNSFNETFKKFQEKINYWLDDVAIELISIGLPCPVSKSLQVIPQTNNLKGWQGVNIIKEFQKHFDIKVLVNNDANFAALGQAIIKEKSNLLFFTISTGIGCGIVINDKIYDGFSGTAGEVANSLMQTNNANEDSCRNGIEFFASGTNIVKNLNNLGVGVKTTKEAFKKFYEKDLTVVSYFKEMENKLVSFFSTMIYVLNPEIVVVGGSVAEHNKSFFENIFARVLTVTNDIAYKTQFEFAEDMTENTLIGAVNYNK